MNKLIPKILIVGLRSCGSTAFWQALSRDSRLCCYDEPFNPQLKDLPCQNAKGTRDELIALYSNDPGTFIRKANQGFKSESQRWNDVFKVAGYEPNNSD